MTRTTLLFATMLLLVTTSFAQVKFGVRAGVQNSRLKAMIDQPGLDLTSRTDLDAGLFFEIPLSPWFAIQPEIAYTTYGAKATVLNDKGEFKMEYFSIPVLAKYRLKNGLAFLVGPSFNFLTAAETRQDGADDADLRGQLKKNDIMATGGMEYNFPFGLVIGARINHSLKNIALEEANGFRYLGFGFHLAYKFNVSGKKK